MIHRLTLNNLNRILVFCLNDPTFTGLHCLIQRCQYARDPERFLISALDASSGVNEIWGIGLYLLSHLDEDEVDLVAILVRTANCPRGVPTWRYDRAALASLRWRSSEVRSWKEQGMGPRLLQKRAQQEFHLRARWERIRWRLGDLLQQALSILRTT